MATSTVKNITVDGYANFAANVYVSATDATAIDLANVSIYGQVRYNHDTANISAIFNCSVVDAANGEFSFGLGQAEVANLSPDIYVYDVIYHNINTGVTKTFVHGNFTVLPAVTKQLWGEAMPGLEATPLATSVYTASTLFPNIIAETPAGYENILGLVFDSDSDKYTVESIQIHSSTIWENAGNTSIVVSGYPLSAGSNNIMTAMMAWDESYGSNTDSIILSKTENPVLYVYCVDSAGHQDVMVNITMRG